ncbi:hypothetical protein EO244_04600 [Ancylomarina salipaludis]|uniref:Zf-HC2 domain-containing protein n=1 Tax=Ancylomarina salipaludis TaxID=2501299 RepID=A0A4Q1JN54_9BACT|nr:hypothetical protein [Ancylomarina salipaludis]RXQ96129.1 hypothetical protein EO244_04600 [Ancylomarina salipaludis]
MMNCITNESIQRFIDCETNLDESVLIKNHLSKCEQCASRVEAQQKLADDIKLALSEHQENYIEIPKINIPHQINRRRPVLKMRMIYALSAACLLSFFVLTFPNKGDFDQDEITMLESFDDDFDANLPVDQQKMMIHVVDPTGKVTEFHVK